MSYATQYRTRPKAERAREMKAAGATWAEIDLELGVRGGWASHAVREADMADRRAKEGDELRRLADEGLSFGEIAARLGLTGRQLARRAKAFGVDLEMPPKGSEARMRKALREIQEIARNAWVDECADAEVFGDLATIAECALAGKAWRRPSSR